MWFKYNLIFIVVSVMFSTSLYGFWFIPNHYIYSGLLSVLWIFLIYIYYQLQKEVYILQKSNQELTNKIQEGVAEQKKQTAEQNRLLQILESTSDMVSTAGPDAYATYINTAGRKMLGWKGDLENFPHRISEAHPQWAAEIIKKEALPMAINEGIWHGETAVLNAKGQEIPVSQILMSHKSEDGQLEYLSTIIRDITKRKQIEKELKLAKESAESANKAKSEFLANMSHEIRTPMNAILGFTSILGEMIKDKQQKEYLDSILNSGKSLLTLINDILDLSKVEAGKLELQYSVVDVPNVFYEMKQIFSQKIQNKNLSFILDIPDNFPKAVLLDEVRLRQILLNLIGNAVKFTSKGHVKLSLDFKQDGEEFNFCFHVEDTGVGIPKEQQESIFGAFVQKKGQSQNQFGGTGLGLAITKRLAEIMGGKIYIASEENKGSTFTVILEHLQVASVEEATKTENESLNIKGVTFAPATILIADDIEINRRLVKVFLQEYQFDFYEAKDGEEACLLTDKILPDLVLMDIKMPILDGYQATKKIKSKSETKHIPVVALTASAMKENEEEVRTVCDGFLSKPVKKEVLIKELMRFLKYERIQEKIPEITTSENKKNIDTSQWKDLLIFLQNQKEAWQEMCSTLAINDIEDFGKEMQEHGHKYGCAPLLDWGKALEEQASMFLLDVLPETLAQFEKVIQEIVTATNE